MPKKKVVAKVGPKSGFAWGSLRNVPPGKKPTVKKTTIVKKKR